MDKKILVKGTYFDSTQELAIKKQCHEQDIEIYFLNDHTPQASFDSLIQLMLNNELLKELLVGIAVDLLKDLVFKIIRHIKEKNVVIISNRQVKPAKLTIRANTDKGTIYVEVPNDISDELYEKSINKILEAKKLLDRKSSTEINDLFIVEDSSNNLEIMTLIEYIEYRKNRSQA